jgi:flagellar biosynthesis protein FlhF
MKLQTFSAATMAEALQQVKSQMGSEAVILHTRTLQRRGWLGFRRREVVEITAGQGINIARPTHRPAARAPAALVRKPVQIDVTPHGDDGRSGTASPGRGLLQSPAAASAVMLGLSEQVNGLKSMVADLVRQNRSSRAPDVPEDLFDYYLQLIQNQVAEELAAEVLKSVRAQIRPEHLQNAAFIRDKLAEQIEELLPTSGPIIRTKKTGPHVVALIGPTGVGKTTTIAKLAASLKLRENHKVGLITIDTYRIAAIDQLRKYAEIIGAPFRVVGNAEDLRAAIESMNACDFVLIDTAGRSPTDTLKLNELKGFLKQAEPDEVHLVLSTTASQECIESAIARFGDVRVDKIIFTKLDEAVHVGVVLNVVRKVNKALSYITTGQDVPDDIEVGVGRRLAQLILGAHP